MCLSADKLYRLGTHTLHVLFSMSLGDNGQMRCAIFRRFHARSEDLCTWASSCGRIRGRLGWCCTPRMMRIRQHVPAITDCACQETSSSYLCRYVGTRDSRLHLLCSQPVPPHETLHVSKAKLVNNKLRREVLVCQTPCQNSALFVSHTQ
jgi:hypothetical protein